MAKKGSTTMSSDSYYIIKSIPSLLNDQLYKITSPITRNYNCVAWALGRDDVWYWPPLGKEPEPDEYWPKGISDDENILTFVSAMEHEGFILCDDIEYEEDYTRIALFAQNGLCSHACRQISNNLWTSKMGPLNDIQHSSPQTLEGDFYGKVHCYMKRPNS